MSFEAARDIFLTVCDLPASERQERVRAACGDDEQLLEAVEALLSGDANPVIGASTSIAAKLEEMVDVQDPDPGSLQEIDRYRILAQLGTGGMGIVYLAEQDAPRRRVALKILRAALDTSEYRSRLLREAETLGRLQHPGIAQVYDAGVATTPRGALPFIAMEYVKGVPLTEYSEKEQLSVAARLKLFIEICEAIHHAHQKGVIHRDLKPDNILVKEHSTTTLKGESARIGRPVVLDFGIARITDSDLAQTAHQTEPGTLLGTLPYMSPEQMTGQSSAIDTRSDIYSLGVILFQLLASRLPIDVSGATLPEAIRRVHQDEPALLGFVDPAFRGDLETIVARALEKDPERRYGSASEFGADVRRFLADEPIIARAHSRVYQLTKLVRRNKGLAAGLAATVIALAAGFAVSTSLYVKARAANAESLAASVMATRQADKATAIRDYVLFDMLGAASPGVMGDAVKVVDVLELAVSGVDGAFGDHPETAAAIRHTLGAAYGKLGQRERAIELLERSWKDFVALLGEDDPLSLRARYDLARQHLALAAFDATEQHLSGLAVAVALGHQIDGRHRDEVALVLGHLHARLGDGGALQLAEEALQRAIGEAGELDERVMQMRGWHVGALLAHRALPEAEALARRQLELLARTSSRTDIAATERLLAHIIFQQGRYEEGRALAERQLESQRLLYGVDHPSTLVTLANYGTMLSDLNDFDGASTAFEEAVAGLERSVGLTHPYVLQVRNNQAIVMRKQGRLDEATQLVNEILEGRRAVLGPEDPSVAQSLDVLAYIQRLQGAPVASRDSLLEAESIYLATLGADHHATLDLRFNLAMAYGSLNEHALKEAKLLELLTGLHAVYGDDHPYVAEAWYEVAHARRFQGLLAAAEQPARDALELRERVLAEGNIRRCDSQALLGAILIELGDVDEGEALMLSALEGFERVGRIDRAHSSGLYPVLNEYYENVGRADQAAEVRKTLAGTDDS